MINQDTFDSGKLRITNSTTGYTYNYDFYYNYGEILYQGRELKDKNQWAMPQTVI